MKTNTKKNGAWQEYNAAREHWLKAVLSNRTLSQRAKITASVMYFYFNEERFAREGVLWTWCSLRTLDAKTGQDRKTVVLAIEDLEAAGYLKIHRQYDPVQKRHHNHRYLALVPTKAPEKQGGVVETGGPGGGGDGWTTLVETGGPYSMNDSMKENSMNNIPLAALAGDLKEEGGRAGPTAPGAEERPSSTRQTASFEPDDNGSASRARVAESHADFRRRMGLGPRQ